MNEPKEIIKGETIEWEESFASYPATDYTLKYYFRGPAAFEKTATANGTGYKITFSATETDALTAGTYWYYAFCEADGERYKVSEGSLEVVDFLDQTTYDGRSEAQKALEAVEAVIRGTASKEQLEYQIAGRSLRYRSVEELITLRDYLKKEVAREKKAEKLRKGLGISNVIKTRLR